MLDSHCGERKLLCAVLGEARRNYSGDNRAYEPVMADEYNVTAFKSYE